jgi:hypothetical protein
LVIRLHRAPGVSTTKRAGIMMEETIARLNIESLRNLVETEQDEMLLRVLRRFLAEEEQKLQQIKSIPNHLRDA